MKSCSVSLITRETRIRTTMSGNSLAVQWLGLCASVAAGLGLIPGWGIKIPQAHGMWCSQKKNKTYNEVSPFTSQNVHHWESLQIMNAGESMEKRNPPILLVGMWIGAATMENSMLLLLLSRFSLVQLFVIPWTVVRQAPLSMPFSRQEYWSGLPCPPLEDFLIQGLNPGHLHCTASLITHLVKNPPAMQETPVQFLGWEALLEKG